MRLIDADRLLSEVDKEREYLIARGQTGAEHILVHNFRDLIEKAPAIITARSTSEGFPIIDMRPRQEARLKVKHVNDWVNYYICGYCECNVDGWDNYCRRCGALLIKEAENNENT